MNVADPYMQLGSPHSIKTWAPTAADNQSFQYSHGIDDSAFSPISATDGRLSSQQSTPSTPWKPPMVTFNSCPNLTSTFGATSLDDAADGASRCATPQQQTRRESVNPEVAVIPDSEGTPTTSSLSNATQPDTADSGLAMGRSYSAGHLMDQVSPGLTYATAGRASDQAGVSSVAPRSLYMSPVKATSHAASASSDANVALRQSTLTRSLSDYSTATDSTGSGPTYDTMCSQSSISPSSAIDRSTSSTSLASSFSSHLTGDECPASRSSPPSSESVPSPVGPTPPLVSLIRRNGTVNANVGRTTRSKSTTASTAGKPRRSSKLTELDRKRICEYHRDHPSANQDAIGLRFGVERSTVSKTLKDKEKWLAVEEDPEATIMSRSASNRRTGAANTNTASRPPSPTLLSPTSPMKMSMNSNRACRFPEVEAQVIDWARATAKMGEYLSDSMLKERARLVATSMNITEQQFKASQGWLERFKVRSGIAAGRFLEEDHPQMPAPLDTSRPYTESAFPLPSPQEPLSSSSSSTSSFFDDQDQDQHTVQYARMHRDSDPSVTLSMSNPSAYAAPMNSATMASFDGTPLSAAQAAHPSSQHYQPVPQNPIAPNDYSQSPGTQNVNMASHLSDPHALRSQQQQQSYPQAASYIYNHTSPFSPHDHALNQAIAFELPKSHAPPLLRRATVSGADARSVGGPYYQQTPYSGYDVRQQGGAYYPVDLQQAQNALTVLTQFLQQQRPRLVSPTALQTLSELQMLLHHPDSGSLLRQAYRSPEAADMYTFKPGELRPAFDPSCDNKAGVSQTFTGSATQAMPPQSQFQALESQIHYQ